MAGGAPPNRDRRDSPNGVAPATLIPARAQPRLGYQNSQPGKRYARLMRFRTLGASGCAVSAFALGTMTFGSETDEAGSRAQLDHFFDAGGNLVDTADVYSGTESESIIGRWLKTQSPEIRDRAVIATKGRFPTGNGPNDVGLSRRHLTRAIDASLRRLGVDCIDLYQVHSYDPLTPIHETLEVLDDAVRMGKINYIGLSNFTGWQVQKAVDVADARNLRRPVTLQPQYNLLAREIEWEVVPACLAEGLGLLPWSPLGGGWLTGKYRRDQLPKGATRLGENPERGVEAYARRNARQKTWDVLATLEQIASGRGRSVAEVALSWLRDRPAVSSVILGCRSVQQLKENLGAIDLDLSEDEAGTLDRASDPAVADYPYGAPGQEQRSRKIEGGR
jgi:aryl-alcohol dehydrogenase-like predicted oxidoreductase